MKWVIKRVKSQLRVMKCVMKSFITLKGDKNNIIYPECDEEIYNKNFIIKKRVMKYVIKRFHHSSRS